MDQHAERVQFAAHATDMLRQAVAGTAIERTLQSPLHQAREGNRVSVLLKQAQQQGIFSGGAVKPLAIDEEQAVGITVLHDVSRYIGQLAQLKMLD